MKKIITILILAFALQSCENKTHKPQVIKESENTAQKIDSAEYWLKNVFKCEKGNGYCFYLDKEKQICTKRFYEFMIESEELFGASNLTEDEYPSALNNYQKKWLKIYPLRNIDIGSSWLFGRGQDDIENIRDVTITKLSNLKYDVFVDYGEGLKTQNKVYLILKNNIYKIDFCSTKFIDDDKAKRSSSIKENQTNIKQKKKLRYLYYANGGIRGYFEDGTIVGCPRCDFCRSNIMAMYNEKPLGTFKVQSNGSLLINNSEKEFPNYKDDNGWVLIDYVWNEKVPQY